MKNKIKILSLLILFIIIIIYINSVLIIAATTTSYINSCNLNIQLVNQDPNPAVPDEYVKVLFQVSGIDNPDCNGAAVMLAPEYPFSLDPDVNPIQSLDKTTYTIPNYKNTWMVPYKLRVASDALEGDYILKLFYHPGNEINPGSFSVINTYNISLTDAQTDFAIVIQDSSSTQVSLGIVNTGKNTANSLIVGVPQQENFRTTGTYEQIVGNLAAGDYTIVSFNVAARNTRNMTRSGSNSGSSGSQVYNPEGQMLKVKLDYTDGIGRRRSVVKEIQFNTLASGNFTSRNLSGSTRNFNSTASSSISYWWYVIGIGVIIIIIYIYRKYGDDIKSYFKKKKNQKNSEKTPDWILAEKTHHKK